jgi:hypothetical protein
VRRRRGARKADVEALAGSAADLPRPETLADPVAIVPEPAPGSASASVSVSVSAPAPEPEPILPAAAESSEPSESAAEARRQQALDLVVGTLEALAAERGEDEKIWGSMVKQTLRRRKPGFSEGYYGFRSFNRLLEEARDRGLIELSLDDKSGGYTVRSLA